jgi:hypothetical protein
MRGSRILFVFNTKHCCYNLEEKIKNEFSKKFNRSAGQEWFEGDEYEMKNVMLKICQGIIINDPKAQLLQSTIIKQNAETIIDKTNERKQYYKSSIEQSNRFEQEPLKEDKDGMKRTNNFIKTIENIKKGAVVDDPNAIKVFLAKGIENKQIITNNALE